MPAWPGNSNCLRRRAHQGHFDVGQFAVVSSQVETAFRLVKGDKRQVARWPEIRTGESALEDGVEMLMKALNLEKTRARGLSWETIATRSSRYRRERGCIY